MTWLRRLFDLVSRRARQKDTDLEEEIRCHLALEAAEQMKAGLSREAAEQLAERRFGNVGLVKEVTRAMWGWGTWERICQDVWYAARALRRSPGFAAAAALSLGLGIGANTATFSLSDALLLRPLPVARPSEIVAISGVTAQNAFEALSYPDLRDFGARSRSLDAIVGYRLNRFAVARPADVVPQMKMGLQVSRGFFGALGVRTPLGRTFTGEEEESPGQAAVMVLSHDFWRQHFGAAPEAVGGTLHLNGIPFTIVGVAPPSFPGLDLLIRPAFYVPLATVDRFTPSADGSLLERRAERSLTVKARLETGATATEAQAELAVVAKALEDAFPDTNRGRTVRVRTEFQSRVQQSPASLVLVALLMGLAGSVLLIACANVASLLLARARARSREIAVRLAIGAGRVRLVQQLLTESLVLSLGGALVGLVLAAASIRFLASLEIPTDTPLVLGAQLDGRVFAFSLLVSVMSVLLFGLAPAWQTARPDIVSALKAGGLDPSGRRPTRGRNLLVVSQVALSLVLLVTSAALLDAFKKMAGVDPGIRTDHVMMMEFDPALVQYGPEQTREFYRLLLEQARALPGVRSATLSRALPFRPNFTDQVVIPEGYELPRDQVGVTVSSNVVDDQYFRTMATDLVKGRAFTSEDRAESRRVAVVNEEFARRFWPDGEPLGRRIQLGVGGPSLEVVGVARTGKYLSVVETPQPYFYLPFSQNPGTRMTLLVETTAAPAGMTQALREVVRSLDPHQPVYNVRDIGTYYQQGVLGPPLLLMKMVGSTGVVGLALAVVGLYGLVAYTVSRRTREIGVRMAIGASRGRILRLVLRQGLTLSLAGAALGLAVSVPLFRMMASALAGLGTLDPKTLVVVPLGLMAVTMCACWLPARRATRIDPIATLRED